MKKYFLLLFLLAAPAHAQAPTVYASANTVVSPAAQTYEIYVLVPRVDINGNPVQVRQDIFKAITVAQLNTQATNLTTQQTNIAAYLALIAAL